MTQCIFNIHIKVFDVNMSKEKISNNKISKIIRIYFQKIDSRNINLDIIVSMVIL